MKHFKVYGIQVIGSVENDPKNPILPMNCHGVVIVAHVLPPNHLDKKSQNRLPGL
jgi:hypothetical protein